jgi:tetratricopeptide (TPR) repeat protein
VSDRLVPTHVPPVTGLPARVSPAEEPWTLDGDRITMIAMDGLDGAASNAARLRNAGDYRGARRAAREAVATLEGAGAGPAPLADALIELGRIEEDLGEHVEARAVLARAGDLTRDHPGAEMTFAVALAELAGIVRYLADPEEARRLTGRAVQLATGTQHAFTPAALSVVLVQAGLDAIEAGEDEVALELIGRATETACSIVGGAGRGRAHVAALLALGKAHQSRGRYEEAARSQRDALAEAEAVLGATSVEAANALNDLGMTGKYEGRFDEARAAYERALAVLDVVAGGSHPDSASILHNLGGLEHARRNFAAAEGPARRAVELRAATLGPDHPVTVLDRAALGSILQGLGHVDEAEAIFRDAIDRLEATLGPDHFELAVTVNNLAAILQQRGALDAAEAHYRRALAIKERALGPDSPLVATGLNNLATVLRRQGRLDEAEALYRRALDVLEAGVEPDHPNLATTRANLDRLLRMRAGDRSAPPDPAQERTSPR